MLNETKKTKIPMRKCLIALLMIIQSVFAQPNTCNVEKEKAKTIYDECMKMDMATKEYAECSRNHNIQRGKAEQACKTIVAQETCNEEKEKTRDTYDKCMKMNMATKEYAECLKNHEIQKHKTEQICRTISVSKCNDEKNVAKTIYDRCVNMDRETIDYMECAEEYKNQKIKVEQICQTISVSKCDDEKKFAKTIYNRCVSMGREAVGYAACAEEYKNQNIMVDQICPAPASFRSTVVPSQQISTSQKTVVNPALSGCMEEFTELAKGNFDMLNFVKKLPPEVIKVKAQLKLPFGKPADSKKTDIGITVGCLKKFPESANEIMPMLKDVSIEMAKEIVASKSGVARSQMSNDMSQLKNLASQAGLTSVANALDFLGK